MPALADELRLILPSHSRMRQRSTFRNAGWVAYRSTTERLVRYRHTVGESTNDEYNHSGGPSATRVLWKRYGLWSRVRGNKSERSGIWTHY